MSDKNEARLVRALQAYGTDLSRWPAEEAGEARRALLQDPAFRRAFDAERSLDGGLQGYRLELQQRPDLAAAEARLRARVINRLPAAPLAGLAWRRVAAAMLVAGTLGGAVNLATPEPLPDQSELVWIDPLYSLDEPQLR